MYLSQLLIDTGGNPDRLRTGKKWIGNIYNVHRRLSMAFPTYEKRRRDPDFLEPYKPEDFDQRAFLYRLDNNVDGQSRRAVIIVQSHTLPDWQWCFHNATDFLAAHPQVRIYEPAYVSGQELRFRICLNASIKSTKYRNPVQPSESDPLSQKTQGKRIALMWDKDKSPDEAALEWFQTKIAGKGFDLHRVELIKLGWVYGFKPVHGSEESLSHTMRFRSALLEGILKVEDPILFATVISNGIGSAKAFGFGLLSVSGN